LALLGMAQSMDSVSSSQHCPAVRMAVVLSLDQGKDPVGPWSTNATPV
jgi:hypothetical protein